MAVPNQSCGLTNFDKRLVSKCPPNPNAIRAIVFLRDHLSVVNGANTEIQIPLKDFFVPVGDAAQINFNIQGNDPDTPFTIYKLDTNSVNMGTDGAKFLGLLAKYDTDDDYQLSPACGGTSKTSSLEFVEWCFDKDIENGNLYSQPPKGPETILNPYGSPFSSLNTTSINKIEFSWGGFLSDSINFGSLWIASDGGLLKWDSKEMKLWNTLNSDSPSDFISTIVVDPMNSLWVGSNNGLSSFSESQGFLKHYKNENSGLPSNSVLSLKFFSVGKLAIGTDEGLSLLDINDESWQNFNVYNTPILTSNEINTLAVDSNFIFSGTPDGVFSYDIFNGTWKVFNDTFPGWDAPNNVTSLEANDGFLYVGTTGGLVVLPVGSTGTAETFIAGPSGPSSDVFLSLRIVDFYGDLRLYAGHDTSISVYSITNDEWILSGPFISSGAKDILPDYLSGNNTVDTIFIASDEEGVGKLTFGSNNGYSRIPESDKVGNILLTYPSENKEFYSSNQPFFFVFSKPLDNSANFPNFVEVAKEVNGNSELVSGSWDYMYSNTLAIFTPDEPLDKATLYNLKVKNGVLLSDGSFLKEKIDVNFYTEDIVPINGWNVLGKMLVHTGTEGNYTTSIYLRNPQSFDVNFTALIGR